MRYLFALLLAAGTSCENAAAPDQTGLYTGVRLGQASFRLGDSVAVTVSIVNRGGEARRIAADTCFGIFVVLNPQGVQVGPGEMHDCFVVSAATTLGPGDSLSFSDYWNGSALPSSNAPAGRVPPGAYRIRAGLSGLVAVSDSTATVQVLP